MTPEIYTILVAGAAFVVGMFCGVVCLAGLIGAFKPGKMEDLEKHNRQLRKNVRYWKKKAQHTGT